MMVGVAQTYPSAYAHVLYSVIFLACPIPRRPCQLATLENKDPWVLACASRPVGPPGQGGEAVMHVRHVG